MSAASLPSTASLGSLPVFVTGPNIRVASRPAEGTVEDNNGEKQDWLHSMHAPTFQDGLA